VILLAIDTCDPRGSLAVLQGDQVIRVVSHDTKEDYSTWLLPAVSRILLEAGLSLEQVEVYAVATGPGSFTGVRVGLTTVKAWGEVYGRKIAAVSRLEAIAGQAATHATDGLVAASTDAQRGQVFGALYRSNGKKLELVEQELVITPGEFVEWAAKQSGEERVTWVSTDPEQITSVERWVAREKRGEKIERVSPILAPMIGKIGFHRAKENRLVDALRLDANYVRRSDAELYWKDGAARAR
jgi:tRNA threonylcarbamoyladenosine biosynthesis protein TsaB